MPVALITGASKGFGRALARLLAERGWSLVLDARGEEELSALAAELPPEVTMAVPGDVADPAHRAALARAVRSFGRLDLLVNNASELGPSPLPQLAGYRLDELERVLAVNVLAPLALVQAHLETLLAGDGVVVNVSSDAAVEAYPGWGGYGASKAALDHLSRVLAVENPALHVYAFDPGDMRTDMHQRAYPGEDISDRPEPGAVVPALLRLVDELPASGRFRARDLFGGGGGPMSAMATARRGPPTPPSAPPGLSATAGPGATPWLSFELPEDRSAREPAEVRGLARDGVRLLVSAGGAPRHARFRDLPDFLRSGDLLVVNTSATLAAAVDGLRADGSPLVVHFSTRLDDGSWAVEPRPPGPATGPLEGVRPGETIALRGGVWLHLVEPWPAPTPARPRLWRAKVIGIRGVEASRSRGGVEALLERFGRPITYAYVRGRWPLEAYQTVFATELGSAEMPSAGRPFTSSLVGRLRRNGIGLAAITLHTGVSSLEAGEAPLPEPFVVPRATAERVAATRRAGRRVVAVGTTVARALESAVSGDGAPMAASGWTDLVLSLARPARLVGGIITGWHAPGASHLELLQAIAGAETVGRAYVEALARGYLWHEFGDSALLFAPRVDRLTVARSGCSVPAPPAP